MSPAANPAALADCKLVSPFRAADDRGEFLKLFSSADLGRFGLGEVFVTTSNMGVLRGMHVHEPPGDQWKLVYCLSGRAYDVLVDLRPGSPTSGQLLEIELAPELDLGLLIAPGVAHGFLALQPDTTMLYCTTSPHDPALDRGVRWDSIGARWPFAPSVISPRDRELPTLAQYVSPFRYPRDEAG